MLSFSKNRISSFSSIDITQKNWRSRYTGKGKEQDRRSIKISSRLYVDCLDVVTSLPSTWAVPGDRSATLVDLSGHEIPSKRNGKEYTIDGFIRAEVRIRNILHPLLAWDFRKKQVVNSNRSAQMESHYKLERSF